MKLFSKVLAGLATGILLVPFSSGLTAGNAAAGPTEWELYDGEGDDLEVRHQGAITNDESILVEYHDVYSSLCLVGPQQVPGVVTLQWVDPTNSDQEVGESASAPAQQDGTWSVEIDTPDVNGGFRLTGSCSGESVGSMLIGVYGKEEPLDRDNFSPRTLQANQAMSLTYIYEGFDQTTVEIFEAGTGGTGNPYFSQTSSSLAAPQFSIVAPNQAGDFEVWVTVESQWGDSIYKDKELLFPLTVVDTRIFTDITEESAFYGDIKWLKESGITAGYSDGSFRPKNSVTRGAMVAFLNRAAGAQDFEPTQRNPYVDVNTEDTFYKQIMWAWENGVSTGVLNKKTGKRYFNADEPVTRGAMSAMLYRQYRATVLPSYAKSPASFRDVPSDHKFYDHIRWMSEYRITTGTGDGSTFSPSGNTTRGAMSAFLHRVDNRLE